MLPKIDATSATDKVNLEYMHKQKVEVIVEELNLSNLKSEWNIQAEVNKYADNVNLLTALQPTSLEENLYSSLEATWQKRLLQDLYNFEDDRKFRHFEAGQIWVVTHRGLPVVCGSLKVNSEMQMSIEVRWPSIAYYKCSWVHGVTEKQFEVYPKRVEIWAVYKDWILDDWSCNPDSVLMEHVW
ncbi:conserved hypothetical protein [Ricinus communis]|uniref:DUF3444 domain-containing protein n=1 Tax=Ricinus communis TaxID=3988 RepID=B9RA71_RICCO|nr:conserved hypothetical protein [Ricinus communis]